ncbi:MAG: SUMF1/EgtB/PvdO family nonheme iron enzyme, partial [Proteobacteria bacterium]|nr:SUMF1/EgtB/PvdO family nonheme iron enzyme [Pseudomonadota bacterium]
SAILGSAFNEARGSNRVIRGGNFNNSANNLRSANRNNNSPGNRNNNIGFRLCSAQDNRQTVDVHGSRPGSPVPNRFAEGRAAAADEHR